MDTTISTLPLTFIEPDAFDHDQNTAKAHGGLRLQAGDGLAGAHFVQVALDVVA